MNKTTAILWHYFQAKYLRQFSTREQLLNWQDHHVQNFLKRTLPQSPFYRRYYKGLALQNWQTFPIIDKAKMMENFDQLNTAKITKEEAFAVALKAEETRDFSANIRGFTIGLSSGTSGNRGLFLVSKAEQFAWAGIILAKALPQSILMPQRIAFFSGQIVTFMNL